MRRFLVSLLIVSAAGVILVAGTSSFLSDTEVSADNTFQSGGIDLKIDSTAHYNGMICDLETKTWIPENPSTTPSPLQFPISGTPCTSSWILTDLTQEKFFNFNDLKPGDMGENTISLHVVDNDAWACMEFNNFQNNDPNITEPESVVDSTEGDGEGELAQSMTMFAWYDDGDNVFEPTANPPEQPLLDPVIQTAEEVLNSPVITLADSTTGNPIVGGPIDDEESTWYIGWQWCLGTLDVDLSSGETSCDSTGLGNETQTDQVLTDVTFRIEQARNNSDFVCNPDEGGCEATGEGFINQTVTTAQGLRRNGTAVLPARSNPNSMFGGANGNAEGSFYSLGFGGSVVVGFANQVFDIPGGDLAIHEVTNGRTSYPNERAKVEVAQNSAGPWVEIGQVDSDKTADGDGAGVDILNINGAFPWIRFVRITDISPTSEFPVPAFNDADGFDIDAIRAINMCLDED